MAGIFAFLGRYKAELVALLVVTIWGTNFVFQKAALEQFEVLAFTFLRFSGMLILAWSVLYFRKLRRNAPKISVHKGDIKQLILSGVLGYTLYITLSGIGLSFTTAFSSALLIAISPVFVALLLWLFKLEKMRGTQWLAILIALGGAAIFLLDKLQIGLKNAGWGDVICLVAAFFYAAYNVVNKPLLSRYPAPILTAYTLTIGVIPVLLACAPALFSQNWSKITLTGWLGLLWSCVMPVYVAWTLWSWVSARAGVARTTSFLFLVPVIGGVTSWLVLHEDFGILKFVGAGLILFSLFVMRRQPKSAAKPQTAPAPEIRPVLPGTEARV